MDRELFARHAAVVRHGLAFELGCEPAHFDTHALTVVPAPESRTDDGALVLTLGTGTVVTVEAPYMSWAREHAPTVHYKAMQPPFLAELAAEMSSGGRAIRAKASSLGYTLADIPPAVELPAGFHIEERGKDWMASDPSLIYEYDNAIGGGEPTDLPERALVLLDGRGTVAAVTGFWPHQQDRYEIGLDVARAFRGQGLARLITNASTLWILERGRVPQYTCQVSNLRSHRVAASCGFVPFWAYASVGTDFTPSAATAAP